MNVFTLFVKKEKLYKVYLCISDGKKPTYSAVRKPK